MTYHKYSFSTLGFAKNASVVKLKPKTTTIQATPAERKLMVELEQMKVSTGRLSVASPRELKETITIAVIHLSSVNGVEGGA